MLCVTKCLAIEQWYEAMSEDRIGSPEFWYTLTATPQRNFGSFPRLNDSLAFVPILAAGRLPAHGAGERK